MRAEEPLVLPLVVEESFTIHRPSTFTACQRSPFPVASTPRAFRSVFRSAAHTSLNRLYWRLLTLTNRRPIGTNADRNFSSRPNPAKYEWDSALAKFAINVMITTNRRRYV